MKNTTIFRSTWIAWTLIAGLQQALGGVTLQAPVQLPAGSAVDSGIPVSITIDAVVDGGSSIDAVKLAYTHDDGVRIWSATNAMTLTGTVGATQTYGGEIPQLNAGSVDYQVICDFDAGASTASSVGSYTIGDAPSVASGRYMPVNTVWSSLGGSNYQYKADTATDYWTASGVYFANDAASRPLGGAGIVILLRDIYGAFIQSPPLEGGVGTIYYTSKARYPNQTPRVHIQVSTNGTPSSDAEWETILPLNYPYANPQINLATPVVINRLDVRCVRFVLVEESPYDSSLNRAFGAVAFDNIVLSYPPADVAIEEKLRNPGYPAQDQDVRMRCEVADTTPGTPTANRRVTLHYQWVLRQSDRPVAGNWLSTNMVPMGGDLYEGVIPRQRPGYVHYYYACDFDGYYYARDPDGPGEEGEYKENTNPRYWETGATVGHTPAFFGRYEVRRYRSEYGRVELTAAPAQATVQMELVGDEIWQGITLVTGITNLTWTFNGFNRYTNDAPYYWSEPVMWGDNDQGFANPPIGGIAEVAATNSMVAEVDYEGFLMMRFDTVERDYIAKRAVYQNFDQWLASKDFFEASLGLYAVQRIDESFNTWPADGYTVDETKSETFELMTPSSTFDGALITTYGWRAGQARVVRERRPLSAMLQGNQGLLLNRVLTEPAGIGGGWVGNSGDSMTLGMERFTTGLRASINDRNFALYTGGYAFPHGQEITLNLLASQLSPEFPSLSVLFSFQPGYPAESYYELRLTQVDETSGTQTDNRFSAQLYRWKAGVPSAALGTYAAAGKLSVAKALVITVSADVNIQVKIDGTVRLNYTDSTADKLNTGGSVAFLTHDAVPLVNTLVVKDLGTGTTLLNHGTGFASTTGWYLGGTPNGGSGNRWTTSGTALTRPVPTQTVSILSAVRRPGASRPDEEDLVELTQVEIASLQYQSIDIPLHKWYEGFVEMRYKAGDVDVVVDNPTVSPWRANSRGPAGGHAEALDIPYSAWTSKAQQHDWLKNEYGWAVLEGMVTDAVGVGVGGQDVHLERTRANPDLDQALVSPVLTNGIGEIEFYASVDGGEAHYAVQRTALGAQDEWVTVRIFTNAVDDLLVKRNVPVRENFTGRIRVLLLPTSDPAARLMLDDATVRDYPPRDDTTWQAYNVLVTDQQDDRLYAGQSAYLNNSVSEDVDGIVNEHQPYIQTPSVGTGIGEISFWYRSWSGTTPTELILKAAPTADTPEEEWVVLTNLVVGAGSDYVYFNNPNIYNLDNHVLRVYGDTNSADRVCIDNILMTEPVRAGYEIQAVRLDPPQPLAGQPVAVEVDIGRFLMNPKEINIYLSYTTGTGVWGTENWWTREDTPGSKRVQLEPVAPGSRTYRSPEGALSALAALPIDAVVQYYVWGTHSEISGPGHTPIFQDESSFEHPAWYAPVNLNTNFAAQGWSPYYFVYSCPPYSVWINEIYPYSTYLPAAGEFIELLGPAQANLGGWRIEALGATSNLVDTCMIAGGFTLTNAYNGWGFFVWGDPGTPNVNQTFDPDIVNNVPANGALNLIRSNGAVEHKVCWSGARTFFEARGYTYAGNKAFLSVQSLSLLGDEPGDSLDDFYWPTSAGGTRTPGNVNNAQFLIDITPEPGGYFLLTSVIGPHGLHDGLAATLLTDSIASGSPAAIQYTADPWYRIGAFTSNGDAVPEAVGTSNYLWSTAAMAGTISNHVTFVAVDTYGEAVSIDWLSQWSEAAVAQGDGDAFGVEDEFLLNTDPTTDTTATLRVTDIAWVGGDLHVTVRLDRDTVNSGFNNGDINGTLVLESRASLLSGGFAEVADTAISGAQFNDGEGGDEHTYVFPGVSDPASFYRAVIR